MPAAAVIPAPIAYIKVVAVKKLVVEVLMVLGSNIHMFDNQPSSAYKHMLVLKQTTM